MHFHEWTFWINHFGDVKTILTFYSVCLIWKIRGNDCNFITWYVQRYIWFLEATATWYIYHSFWCLFKMHANSLSFVKVISRILMKRWAKTQQFGIWPIFELITTYFENIWKCVVKSKIHFCCQFHGAMASWPYFLLGRTWLEKSNLVEYLVVVGCCLLKNVPKGWQMLRDNVKTQQHCICSCILALVSALRCKG